MPFAGFEDWEDCIDTMVNEEGYTEEEAEKICGSLEAEAKLEEGDPEGLLKEIMNNATNIITDLGLDLVSAVKTPAQPSDWIMLKSEDSEYDWNSQTPIVFNEEIAKQVSEEGDEEKRIAFAPALVPNQTDKEGDVVPSATIYDSAHNFMKRSQGDEIDTEHNLIEGKGDIIESWTLKEEQTFELPNGETKTYPPVTWMLGIEFDQETWKRIKEGELKGLSIMGKSEKIAVNKKAIENCPNCGEVIKDSKLEDKQNDSSRICGYLWFHGTDAQHNAFGNGDEGRGTDEKPPKAWWDDCISTIEASSLSEEQAEKLEKLRKQDDENPLSKESDNTHDTMSDEDIKELKETLGTLKEKIDSIESTIEEKEQKEKLESKEGIRDILTEKLDEEKADTIINTLTEDKETEAETETETESNEKEEDEEEEDEDEKEQEEPNSEPAEKGYSGKGVQEERKSLEKDTEKSIKEGDIMKAVQEKYGGEQ